MPLKAAMIQTAYGFYLFIHSFYESTALAQFHFYCCLLILWKYCFQFPYSILLIADLCHNTMLCGVFLTERQYDKRLWGDKCNLKYLSKTTNNVFLSHVWCPTLSSVDHVWKWLPRCRGVDPVGSRVQCHYSSSVLYY